MRKFVVVFAAIAFIALGAQSQTTSFGVKAGMTAANMKYSTSGIHINTSSKIGFYAGAFADLGLSENFGIQPELFYSILGGKMKVSGSGEGSGFSGSEDLGYINLPILLKYKHEGFSAFLGPQISYLLSAKSKQSGESSVDSKDNYKSTDVSGVIGAGYTLTNGFGFDARYQMGFNNITKATEGLEGLTTKNNAFMVGVHYVFNK